MTPATHNDLSPSIHGGFVVMLETDNKRLIPAFMTFDRKALLEWLGELDWRDSCKRSVFLVSAEEERWLDVTEEIAALIADGFEGIGDDTEADDFPAFAVCHAPEACAANVANYRAGSATIRHEREAFFAHSRAGISA